MENNKINESIEMAFDVEAIVKELEPYYTLEENGRVTMHYNDLVEYTTFIIGTILNSAIKETDKLVNQANDKPLNFN